MALGEELFAEECGAVQGGQHAPVGQERPVPVRLLPLLHQQPGRCLLSHHPSLCSTALALKQSKLHLGCKDTMLPSASLEKSPPQKSRVLPYVSACPLFSGYLHAVMTAKGAVGLKQKAAVKFTDIDVCVDWITYWPLGVGWGTKLNDELLGDVRDSLSLCNVPRGHGASQPSFVDRSHS